VHLQREKVDWWSVPVEQAEAEASARVPVDTWQEVLENALDDRRSYTMSQIMGEILKIEVRDQDRSNQLRVADIMRTLGFESQLRRESRRKVRRVWATSVTE
jgi:predicted P-loop ATPase